MRGLAAIAVLAAACHDDPRFATLHMIEPPPAVALAPVHPIDATLANGMHVAVLRDPRAPLVTLDLRYEVGAADDPPDRPGMALLAAHVLADRTAADVALTLTVAVDLDRTLLTTSVIDGDARAALELEARRLETTCTDLAPGLLARAQHEAIAQLSGPPPSLAAAVFGPQHPYAHVLGTPAIAQVSAAELCAFLTAHYAPRTATLVAAGSLDDSVLAAIRARFARIPSGHVAPRAPVGAIEPTHDRVRIPILGLAKPTAMLAFPLLGAPEPDDMDVTLAIRRLESNEGIHAFVVGGERVRALVVVRTATSERDLDSAHERLAQAVELTSRTLESGDDERPEASETLTTAQRGDDVLSRGGDLAARLGRPLPPYERDASSGAVRRWCAEHLALASARRIDALPQLLDGVPGLELDVLAQEPAAVDASLAVGDPSALITPALRAPQPIAEMSLPNGLRVILAPDPRALVVDLRLSVPVGTRNATRPQVAQHAAEGLTSLDGPAGHESVGLVEWYGKLPVRASVDVTDTTTQFHSLGLANAVDWHVFGLAWLVTQGHYPSELSRETRDELEQFRAHAYRPAGATLIIAGNFDAPAVRTSVTRWFGAWTAPAAATKLPTTPALPRTLSQDHVNGALQATLVVRPAIAAHTAQERAARMLVTSLVQQRLAAALGDQGVATATYRARGDEALTLVVQTDPGNGRAVGATIDRELTRIQTEGSASPDEMSRARRVTIALQLAASVGPSGRAAQLEQAVELGAPLDEADRELDALRTASGDDIRAAATSLLAPP